MAVEGLDHVQLACPPGGEDEARRFYGELLGLTEIEKPPALAARGGVWFECGASQQLHLGVEEGFSPARKAHPALLVANAASLEALAERLPVVTWDEDEMQVENRIPTIIVGAGVKAGNYSTPLTHYSLSRWLSELAGGQPLRNAQTAPDLAAAFGLT